MIARADQLLAEQRERAEFLAQQVRDLAALVERFKEQEPEAYRRVVTGGGR